jgi:hypothetical protein
MFALARLKDNKGFVEKVLPILNGDLGILYSLKSDCDTLLYLAENEDALPVEKVRYEIDQFRSRVSHLYQIDGVAARGNALLSEINRLTTVPPQRLRGAIEKFSEGLEGLLNTYAKREMDAAGLKPTAAFLP